MDELMIKQFNALRLMLYKKHSVALHRIQMEATLQDMGLDSMAMLELAFDIEDTFRIGACDEKHLATVTLAQLLIYIQGETQA